MSSNTFYVLMFVVIALGITIIGASFGGQIMSDTQTDQLTGAAGCNTTHVTNCGYDYNISQDGLTAIDTVGSKFNLLATVTIAGLIITTLLTYFAVRKFRG